MLRPAAEITEKALKALNKQAWEALNTTLGLPHHLKQVILPSSKPGEMPGTLRVKDDAVPPKITVMKYNAEMLEEEVLSIQQLSELMPSDTHMTWIQIEGFGDLEMFEMLIRDWEFHRLAMEDVLGNSQRAKLDEYDEHYFMMLRTPLQSEQQRFIQFSLFMGKNFVVTFVEKQTEFLEPIRQRLLSGKGKIRMWGADYLSFTFLDLVIDHYFPLIDVLDRSLEEVEEDIFKESVDTVLSRLHTIKRIANEMKRTLRGFPTVIDRFEKDAEGLVADETKYYLRDARDHALRCLELVESDQSQASDLMGLYHSTLATKMNEVMKVLTIITSVFIPSTFVAGIYGMNFDTDSPYNLPELSWTYGYPFALTLMFTSAILILLYFKKVRWI